MQLYLRKLRSLYVWLLAALTDTGVAMPWILLLYWSAAGRDWTRAVPGIWLALAVYGAAALWETGDRGASQAPGRRRAVALVAGVAAAYLAAYFVLPGAMRTGLLSFNTALCYVPAAAYLWYMGALTVTDGVNYTRLFSRYPYQCAAAAVAVAFLGKTGGLADAGVRVLLYWSVMLVLASGLLALVGARERLLKAGQADIGEKAVGNTGLERLLGYVVVALVLLTFSAYYLVTSDRIGAFTAGTKQVFESVWNAMMAVLWLIISKYITATGHLLEWGIKVIRRFMHPLPPRDGDTGEVASDGKSELLKHINQNPYQDWSPYLKLVVFLAVIILAVVVVSRLIKRKSPQESEGEEEIVDLGFWSNLAGDLKGLFGARRPGARGGRPQVEQLDPRDPRMLFRRLQSWGAAIGRPRQASETPTAYGSALGAASPDDAQAAGAVTAVYNQARYGATPPSAAAVDGAGDAVARLEAERLPKP